MRTSIIVMTVLLSGSAAAQTTCTTYGSRTDCNTIAPLQLPTQSNIGQQMLNNIYRPIPQSDNSAALAAIIAARQQQITQQQAQQADAEQASAARRADAYGKVGGLIASGQCDKAKALAQFYNHPDIIADTARACP